MLSGLKYHSRNGDNKTQFIEIYL